MPKKQVALQDSLKLRVELSELAVVRDHLVSHLAHRQELLTGGVVAPELLRLQLLEALEGDLLPDTTSRAESAIADLRGSLDPDQHEIPRPPERLHLGGVADRVDHVVPVPGQSCNSPLRENPHPQPLPERPSTGDHLLPRRFQPVSSEIISDYVGEGDGIEAPGLEEPDDLRLSGRV